MPQTKEERNARRRERYHNNPEHRQKILDAQRKQRETNKNNPEWVEKERKRLRDYKRSKRATDPEWVEKQNKARRDKYASDPKYRKKISSKRSQEQRERYNNDPKHRRHILDKMRENRISKKLRAIEYTGGLQCHGEHCVHIKHDEPIDLFNIDFHHVIAENKTENFNRLFSSHSWKRCKEEIDNCAAIPLCRMCHGKEEHGK